MQSHESSNNSDTKKKMKGSKMVLIVAGFILLAILVGFFIMFLWNMTMTPLFDLPNITYWQAIGLFVLAKMFFGIGGKSHHSKGRRKKKPSAEQSKEMDFTSDTAFKDFWQGEGKEAYEAYLAEHNGSKEPKESE